MACNVVSFQSSSSSLLMMICFADARTVKTSAPLNISPSPSTSAEQSLPPTRIAMRGSNQLSLETPQNKAGMFLKVCQFVMDFTIV